MLPAAHRLSDAASFRDATRRGRRAAGRSVVVHLLTRGDQPSRDEPAQDEPAPDQPAQVGLVVSRAVGDAVTRNRVKRRLRHLLRPVLPALPDGSVLVVRALPGAGVATSADLSRDLRGCLPRAGVPDVGDGGRTGVSA